MTTHNVIVHSLIKALKRKYPNFSSLQKASDIRPDPKSLFPGYYKICPCPPDGSASKKESKGQGSKGSGNSWKLWKGLSLFVAIPAILVLTGFVMFTREKHERPEFVPYEYLRIRHKRFPWRDGKTSLFHNPHLNPLPEGYEDELEAKEGGEDSDAEDAAE